VRLGPAVGWIWVQGRQGQGQGQGQGQAQRPVLHPPVTPLQQAQPLWPPHQLALHYQAGVMARGQMGQGVAAGAVAAVVVVDLGLVAQLVLARRLQLQL
jgi:hypothetical protein